MASPGGAFLRGRSAWTTLDVEELEAHKEKHTAGLLTHGYHGVQGAALDFRS